MNKKELGQKLYELRKAKGLSQEELAELIDVSRQTICKWEKGEVNIRFEQVKKLSELFSVDISHFIGDEKPVVVDEKPVEKTKTKKVGLITLGVFVGSAAILTIAFAVLALLSSDEGGFETLSVNVFPGGYIGLFVFSLIALAASGIILVIYIRKNKKQ